MRLSRPLVFGACVCGGVDGVAACGCWSWLVVDGREGVRRALVVFERRRALLSAPSYIITYIILHAINSSDIV